MQSWRAANEGWAVRFYDDEACIEFVSREFPAYLQAYRQLPKDVERSDFFRRAHPNPLEFCWAGAGQGVAQLRMTPVHLQRTLTRYTP